MFKNPGGKVKSYAKVLFWIGAVISVLIGVFFIGSSFVQAAYSYNNGFGTVLFGIIGGVIIAAIGILLSWINVLVLYAFGTLVENSDTLVRLNGGTPSGDKHAEKIEVQQSIQNFKQEAPKPVETPIETVAPQTTDKTCPTCGQPVDGDAHFCRNCGTKID